MKDTQRAIQNLIQFGTITQTKVSDGKMLARVKVDDDRETNFFPVQTFGNSFKRKAEPIRANEQVMVLCPKGNADVGVILRGLLNVHCEEPDEYSDTKEVTEYEDGTTISYDTESSTLEVSCVGDIEIISTGDISLRGSRIYINEDKE